MQLIPFLKRHARYADCVDAFVDGELRGADLAQFQRHLDACGTCPASVAAARALKAALKSLPEHPAPRSFALTPAMLSDGRRERAPAAIGTPLYLGLARVAAAVSVVAFVAVFTVSLMGGDSRSSDQQLTSAAAERNGAPQAADNAAGGAPSTESSSNYAVGTPTVLLAPATSGAVSGAGAPSATPAPPSTGAQPTPAVPQPNDGSVVTKLAGNDGAALGDASVIEPSAAGRKDDDSGIPWTIVMGSVAGVLVGVLLVAESRRKRS